MKRQGVYRVSSKQVTGVLIWAMLLLVSCSKKESNYIFFYPYYGETVKDADSNAYQTVYILGQTWMIQNLKVTRFRDGTPIPNVADSDAWASLMTPAYCDYENNPEASKTYGRLYNWYAVTHGNLCPYPFHVPDDDDWQRLIDTLGGPGTAGGKLKEAGTSHWQNNYGATNQYGFKALPGGKRDTEGDFNGIGSAGYWWGNPLSLNLILVRSLHYDTPTIDRTNAGKRDGFSVRCVRDF